MSNIFLGLFSFRPFFSAHWWIQVSNSLNVEINILNKNTGQIKWVEVDEIQCGTLTFLETSSLIKWIWIDVEETQFGRFARNIFCIRLAKSNGLNWLKYNLERWMIKPVVEGTWMHKPMSSLTRQIGSKL